MARKSRDQRNQDILAALSPEVLRERQRIVDSAVRAARNSGHCDTFNTMIGQVFPEMMVDISGYTVALDSAGGSCASSSSAWAYYGGGRDETPPTRDAQGYDGRGYDRDGFNRHGLDEEGFDASNMGRSRSRVSRRTRWVDDAGQEQQVTERWYQTGFGEYSNRDAEGNLRVGRGPTEQEAAEEAATLAAFEEKYADRWNPTSWVPSTQDAS